MKFVIRAARASGCRRGAMVEFARHPDKIVETPTCTLYTRGGSVPHLTPDVWEKLTHLPSIAQMPMPLLVEHHEDVREFRKGLDGFTSMQGSIVFSTVQDSANELPTGYNDTQSVAVWGKGGKYRLEPDHYMDVQEAFQPDIYQALSDGDTGKTTTKKRLRKSIDRTLNFLDQCLERHKKSEVLKNTAVFGAIEGGYQIEERLKSAKETSSRPVHGFSIEGFHNFGPGMEDIEFDKIKDILQKTVLALPADRPRLMQGAWRPDHILSAIGCGLDILDSSYPYVVTERGEALVFDFKLCSKKSCQDETGDITEEITRNASARTGFTIDLKDKRYREDLNPVLDLCPCYCCQTFTRSYICHLLNTSELLASVLLMIHNFHHYFEFFHTIRQAIEEDKFSNLVQLIEKQSPYNDSDDCKEY